MSSDEQFKTLKIGIACQAFKQAGGMERYVLDLVEAFHQLGIRPIVFARNFDEKLEHYAWIDAVKVNVNWLPSKCRDYWYSRQMRGLKTSYQIDLLLSTSRIDCADIAICGGTHKGFLSALNKKVSLWDKIQCKLEERLYCNAKVVIAHSKLMKEEIHKLYDIDLSKIHCIYPPVNLNQFSALKSSEDKKSLRRQLGLPEDKYLFVFPVGGDFKRKGLPLLKAVFHTTDLPIELLVVGKDPKDYFNNMRYWGYSSDMKSLYQAADFTIMASLYEPFGLIGPESIACGTTLLLSDRVACNEIFSDKESISFKALSSEDLEQKIRHLINKNSQIPLDPMNSKDIENALKHLDDPQEHLKKVLSLWN